MRHVEPIERRGDFAACWARAALFALFSAIGLLFFSHRRLDDLARGISGTTEVRFIEEMTGAYAAIIIVPIVTRQRAVLLQPLVEQRDRAWRSR